MDMGRSLLWTLLIAAAWTQVLGQELVVDAQRPQYPALGQNTTLDCDCGGLQCEQMAWFRMLLPGDTLQMLGLSNQADRVTYEPGLESKVRVSKRSGAGYSLRILSTAAADRGMYACVLKVRGNDKSTYEVVKGGTLLLPGESPPTDAPQLVPKAPTPPRCPCQTHTQPPDGCGSLVLWPLVGLASALCGTLVCTLLYYSRLPKKCRHNFVRKK